MKTVTLHLDPPADPAEAGRALSELSGVMATEIRGDRLVVHCGRRMSGEALIHTLQSRGCSARELFSSPE